MRTTDNIQVKESAVECLSFVGTTLEGSDEVMIAILPEFESDCSLSFSQKDSPQNSWPFYLNAFARLARSMRNGFGIFRCLLTRVPFLPRVVTPMIQALNNLAQVDIAALILDVWSLMATHVDVGDYVIQMASKMPSLFKYFSSLSHSQFSL